MKKTLTLSGIALAIIASLFVGSHYASAMASIFMAPTKTAAATTTLAWLTTGNGTTTVTLATPLSMGMSTKYDKALVLVELTATSSLANTANVKARVEYSLDGIDWFSAGTIPTGTATSSVVASNDITIIVATSSAYTLAGNGTNRVHQSFFIETPTPYNRVVFYNTGSASVSLWAAIQPIKEVQVLNQ